MEERVGSGGRLYWITPLPHPGLSSQKTCNPSKTKRSLLLTFKRNLMKSINSFSLAKTIASQPLSRALIAAAGIGLIALPNFSQAAPEDKPYKIINTAQTMGT